VTYGEDMCGRFALYLFEGLRSFDSELRCRNGELPFAARYNIAPTQKVLVDADFGNGREIRALTWGLIPSRSTDGKGFINARAETIEQKLAFSESFRRRRCLIPANGFFEWQRSGRASRPFYFQARDGGLLLFAGIWDTWRDGDQLVQSCAILTTAANELIGELHTRMPVIVPPQLHTAWLDRSTSRLELLRMLKSYPASLMKAHPVSSTVNSVDNEGGELIEHVDVEVGQTPSLF
jgi:putative SOS response-associated peptidase YedK